MSDFWAEAAQQEVAPPPSTGSDLPNDLRVIVANVTEDVSEKAAAKVKPFEGSNGTFYKFALGFVVVGGDKNALKYKGRYMFNDLYVHKRAEDSAKLPLSGMLYNLMLDMLAPGGDDIQQRWGLVLNKLGAAASEAGLIGNETLEADAQLYYATAFAALLRQQSYQVVGKTYTPKQKEGSTFVPKTTLGSIEAATSEVFAKRKIELYPDVNTEF